MVIDKKPVLKKFGLSPCNTAVLLPGKLEDNYEKNGRSNGTIGYALLPVS